MITKLLLLCLFVGMAHACDNIVQCLVNPCQVETCPNQPTAKCVPDYCGGCNAKFYLNGRLLADNECDVPIRSCSEISDIKECGLRSGCVWYQGSCASGDDTASTVQACHTYTTALQCENDVFCDYDERLGLCVVASSQTRQINTARAVKLSVEDAFAKLATLSVASTAGTATTATALDAKTTTAIKKLKIAGSILSLDNIHQLSAVCAAAGSVSCKNFVGCSTVYDKCVPNVLDFCKGQTLEDCEMSELCDLTADMTQCVPSATACDINDPSLTPTEVAKKCRNVIGCMVETDPSTGDISCVPQTIVGDTVQCFGKSLGECGYHPHCLFDLESWQCLPDISARTVECSSIYDPYQCNSVSGCIYDKYAKNCTTDVFVTSSECAFLSEDACYLNANCEFIKHKGCVLRNVTLTVLDVAPCDFGYDTHLCNKAMGCAVDKTTGMCVVDATGVNICTGLLPQQCALFPQFCHIDTLHGRCVAGAPVDCDTLTTAATCEAEPTCQVVEDNYGTFLRCQDRPIVQKNTCTGLPKESCLHSTQFCSFFNYECVPLEVEVAAICDDIRSAALCATTLGCVFDDYAGKCSSSLNVNVQCSGLNNLKCATTRGCTLYSGKCIKDAHHPVEATCRGLGYTDCARNKHCWHTGRYCEDITTVSSLCFGLDQHACTQPELAGICSFEGYNCVEVDRIVETHYYKPYPEVATTTVAQQPTATADAAARIAELVRDVVREAVPVPATISQAPPATRVITVATPQQDFCSIYDQFECRDSNTCTWVAGTTGCVSNARLETSNQCRIFSQFECVQQLSRGCVWKENYTGNFLGECMALKPVKNMLVQQIEALPATVIPATVSTPVQISVQTPVQTPVQTSTGTVNIAPATPVTQTVSQQVQPKTQQDIETMINDVLAKLLKQQGVPTQKVTSTTSTDALTGATTTDPVVVEKIVVYPSYSTANVTKDPKDLLGLNNVYKKNDTITPELANLLKEFSSITDFSKTSFAEADIARLEAALAQQKANTASHEAFAASTAADLTNDFNQIGDAQLLNEKAAQLHEDAAAAELQAGLYGSLAQQASAYGIFGKGLTTIEEILTFGFLTHARIQCSSFTYEFCLQNNFQCVWNPKTFLCYDRGSAAASIASECALYDRSVCLVHNQDCIWDHSTQQCFDATLEYTNSENCQYLTNAIDCADAEFACLWSQDVGLCLPRTPVPSSLYKRITVTNSPLIPPPCRSQVRIDVFLEGKVYGGSIYTEMDYLRKADLQFRARASAFFLEHFGVDFATADYYQGVQLVPFKLSDELFAQVLDYNLFTPDVIIPKRNRILIDGYQVLAREKNEGIISGNYARTLGVKTGFLDHNEHLVYMEFRVVDEYGAIYHQFGISTMYPQERDENLGVMPSVSLVRHFDWGTGVFRSNEKTHSGPDFSKIRLSGVLFFGECSTINEAYKKTLDALDYAAVEAQLLATSGSFLGLRATPASQVFDGKGTYTKGAPPPMPVTKPAPAQQQIPQQTQVPTQAQMPQQTQVPQGQYPQQQVPQQQYPQQQIPQGQQYPQQQVPQQIPQGQQYPPQQASQQYPQQQVPQQQYPQQQIPQGQQYPQQQVPQQYPQQYPQQQMPQQAYNPLLQFQGTSL